ncbi:MAG: M20/M25/M40 family metallo-hydrolase [Bacteroidales bacterium]
MKRTLLLVISITISFTSYSQQPQVSPEITPQELLYHVSILASDSLQGRYPGTTYDKVSAKYIKDQFNSYGLHLIGNQGYQFFTIEKPSPRRLANTHLMINGKRLTYSIDYTTLPTGGSDSLCAAAVFVGFGSDGRHGEPNEYSNVDVKKKWAVMFKEHSKADTIRKDEMRPMNLTALDIAKSHSAAGIIILNDDKNDGEFFENNGKNYGMPIFILNKESSKNLVKELGDIDSLKKVILAEKKSISGNLPETIICGKVGKSTEEINTQNVIALLKGSDPSLYNEYIVVGAHYDHLGLGGKNSYSRMPDTIAVHNGADDNASGVSSVLEIAQKLASQKEQLKRSVLFIAFGAEEMGIVGSQKFVESGIVPVGNIKAMINLDMVGRLRDNKLEISGTKTSMQSESILRELNADSTLSLTLAPGGFGPSDHASFYAKDIPVFFLTTGVHPDYHTPMDDVDKINAVGMEKVAAYAYSLAYKLCTMDSSLTFTKSGSRMMPTYNGKKFKVTLGIIPDVSGSTGNGLKAIGVTEGKPAYRAGMKNGDIIVSINGKPVADINDYMDRLSELSVDTVATVVVVRNNESITLSISL